MTHKLQPEGKRATVGDVFDELVQTLRKEADLLEELRSKFEAMEQLLKSGAAPKPEICEECGETIVDPAIDHDGYCPAHPGLL